VMLMLMVAEVLWLSELLMLIHSHSNDMLRARRGEEGPGHPPASTGNGWMDVWMDGRREG